MPPNFYYDQEDLLRTRQQGKSWHWTVLRPEGTSGFGLGNPMNAPGGIRYYAESVLRSEIFQLTRRDDPNRYLHVIAFIAHQFYRLQDNLVDVLLTSLRSFQNGAIREHKEPSLLTVVCSSGSKKPVGADL